MRDRGRDRDDPHLGAWRRFNAKVNRPGDAASSDEPAEPAEAPAGQAISMRSETSPSAAS